MSGKVREFRRRVAEEAAFLLYNRLATEIIHAKRKAAEQLGVRVYPSNKEVAEALQKLVFLNELKLSNVLTLMRREALEIMKILCDFSPRLVGSVWRGTIKPGSDIDIHVFSDEPDKVVKVLLDSGFSAKRVETKLVNDVEVVHIYFYSKSGFPVEVVVKPLTLKDVPSKCVLFNEFFLGLEIDELERLLKNLEAKT